MESLPSSSAAVILAPLRRAAVDPGTLSILEQRWRTVLERIDAAAARGGRAAGSVTLVAVTKSVDPEIAAALHALGQLDLAENRVQELERKAAAAPRARWHMVGPIQANKVRKAIRIAQLFHAIDDAALLPRLDRIAAEESRRARVLLEVNVSGEATKHGVRPGDVDATLRAALPLARVDVEGLMTMAPAGASADEVRRLFRELRTLRDRAADASLFRGAIRERGELSMGMSGDFEIAIEEGATYVRVGSLLFDPLPGRAAA